MKLFLMITLLFFYFALKAASKPYEPQFKGGFTSVKVTKFKLKSGKIDKSTVEILDSIQIDVHGNTIASTSFDNNKATKTFKVDQKYNEKGWLVESVYHSADGKAFSRFQYNYDERGNRIEELTFANSEIASMRAEHRYDSHDFLLADIYYQIIDGKEEFADSIVYKNDMHGNPLEQATIQANGSASTVKYEYIYYHAGNIKRSVRTSFDDFKFIKEFVYDDLGNVTEETYFDDKGKASVKCVYEYGK